MAKFKVGYGNAMILLDIANNMPIETIRLKWKNLEYGEPDERPKPEYIKGWMKL